MPLLVIGDVGQKGSPCCCWRVIWFWVLFLFSRGECFASPYRLPHFVHPGLHDLFGGRFVKWCGFYLAAICLLSLGQTSAMRCVYFFSPLQASPRRQRGATSPRRRSWRVSRTTTRSGGDFSSSKSPRQLVHTPCMWDPRKKIREKIFNCGRIYESTAATT